MDNESRHIISLLVNNKPGALIRVAQVFTRRSYNINSINVSSLDASKYSHMTITSFGADQTFKQIILQLEKLIDVIRVIEHSQDEAIFRELALIKLQFKDNGHELTKLNIANTQVTVIEKLSDYAILQLVAETDSIDAAIQLLNVNYKIIDVLRSGTVSITHANLSNT